MDSSTVHHLRMAATALKQLHERIGALWDCMYYHKAFSSAKDHVNGSPDTAVEVKA